jgi:site-specific DNA recombinase
VVGGAEVRKTKRRVRDALAANAASGRPHGRVAYGWTREWEVEASGRRHFLREVVDHAQAEVIRDAAHRLLCGESLHSISRDLNSRGVPPPDHGQWDTKKLRQVLVRERNRGQRVHRGKPIGAGQWPPILTEAVHLQVVSKLQEPGRRFPRGPAVAHLLSGIARCGVCGASMRAAKGSLRCSRPASHVTRNEAAVDSLVRDVVVGRLMLPDITELLRPPEEEDDQGIADELALLQARRDQGADAYAAGTVDLRAWQRADEAISRQIEALTPKQRRPTGKPAAMELAGPDAARSWERAPLERRRSVVQELLTIRIMPTRKGARYFDPNSVEITWRS